MAQQITLVDRYGNPIGADNQQNLLAAAGAPWYQETTRRGTWSVNTTTAVASLTGLPTTAHGFAIQNQAPDAGPSVVIDAVGVLITVNSAALPHVGIIGNLGQTRVANVTDAGLAVKSMNGMGQVAGHPLVKSLLTGTALDAVTGVVANWFPIGDSFNAAVTSLPGLQKVVPIDGRIVVAPGRMFALHTLGSVTSSSAQFYIWFHMEQMSLLTN